MISWVCWCLIDLAAYKKPVLGLLPRKNSGVPLATRSFSYWILHIPKDRTSWIAGTDCEDLEEVAQQHWQDVTAMLCACHNTQLIRTIVALCLLHEFLQSLLAQQWLHVLFCSFLFLVDCCDMQSLPSSASLLLTSHWSSVGWWMLKHGEQQQQHLVVLALCGCGYNKLIFLRYK